MALGRYVSLCIVAGCVLVALWRTSTSGAPAIPVGASGASELASSFANSEPGRRIEARRAFPGDPWSQDDDFHHQEERWIRDQWAGSGLTPGELLRAIDEDIRSHAFTGARKATASPCRPRPVSE